MTLQFLICQVDLFEDDRKVTPSAGCTCSFLYVCFLMVGLIVTGDSQSIISNANHWGTTTGHFGIQKIIHWLSVALEDFQLHLSTVAQQSEGNVFTRRNYLCARPEEGTNINLKFVWAFTGTKELGPIKFCQGQQSMDKGKINSRCLLVCACSKFWGGGRVGGLRMCHPPFHPPPLDFQSKIKNFCHLTLLKIRFKIIVTPPPLKNRQSQNYGASINSNGLLIV